MNGKVILSVAILVLLLGAAMPQTQTTESTTCTGEEFSPDRSCVTGEVETGNPAKATFQGFGFVLFIVGGIISVRNSLVPTDSSSTRDTSEQPDSSIAWYSSDKLDESYPHNNRTHSDEDAKNTSQNTNISQNDAAGDCSIKVTADGKRLKDGEIVTISKVVETRDIEEAKREFDSYCEENNIIRELEPEFEIIRD